MQQMEEKQANGITDQLCMHACKEGKAKKKRLVTVAYHICCYTILRN
jgi:hypothetical protein